MLSPALGWKPSCFLAWTNWVWPPVLVEVTECVHFDNFMLPHTYTYTHAILKNHLTGTLIAASGGPLINTFRHALARGKCGCAAMLTCWHIEFQNSSLPPGDVLDEAAAGAEEPEPSWGAQTILSYSLVV